jgi:hypothetical protein
MLPITRCCTRLAGIVGLLLASLPFLAVPGTAAAATADMPLKSAYGTDVTDIWYNPTQSGWGMQLNQTGSFVFATIFVYGTGGQPTWVTGELEGAGGSTFTGPLYVNTGPYYGGTWNPGAVTSRRAGTMTFTLTSATTGQLNYTVDGVAVAKSVQRQPLTLDDYNGTYIAVVIQTNSGCYDPADNGEGGGALLIDISQNATAMTMRTEDPLVENTCTVSGTYAQAGRMGRFAGSYSCSTGDSGTATFAEMTNSTQQFSAKATLTSALFGCVMSMRMTAIAP